VHFLVQPHLVELLRGAPGLGEVRDYWTDDPLPPHEVDTEIMELPYALRMTLPRLPPPYPHLRDQIARITDLALPAEGRLRVGLLWAASDWDRARTVPLAALAPLFALEEVRFFSLQQGEAASDPLLQRLDIACLSPRTRQVEAAAAAMDALDLVICVDGMPAHLAGTLGRPTWVLLKHAADWRWMDARADTPWYPSMRLFRQQREGDWSAVAREVAAALQSLAAAHRQRTEASV
jgi:ADP-heptose:LPS heptosyltransferase